MTFPILPIGHMKSLSLEQYVQLRLNLNNCGYSELFYYQDSIFSVMVHRGIPFRTENILNLDFIKGGYAVTRFLKTDFHLSLNEHVLMIWQKFLALRIQPDGRSLIPELSGFRFPVIPLLEGMCQITKRQRD